MKSFIILLSVFCLLHTQLPQVYAQGPSFSDAQGDADGLVEEGAASLESTVTDYQEYTEDNTQIILQTLTILIIAITTPIFALSCVKAADVWINMIAGIILMVMEGVLWGAYSGGATQELKILDGTLDEYTTQLTAMTTAMKVAQKAKTWLTARMGVIIGATVIVGIAIAVVLIMSIIEVVRSWGAETPKAGSCYAYQDPLEKGVDKLYAQNPTIDWPMSLGDMADRFDTAGNVGDAYFINKELEGLKNGTVKSPSIKDYELTNNMEDFSEIIQGTDGIMKEMVTYLRSMGDVVIPPANAFVEAKDMAPKLAAVGIGVTAGAIKGIMLSVKGGFVASKINGWIRAAWYAVEIGLLIWLSVESSRTANNMGDQADAYQALADKLKGLIENRPPVPGAPPTQTIRPTNVARSGASGEALGALNGSCTTGGSPGTYKSDTSCKCKGKGTCKKIKMPQTNFAGFKTPGVITGSASLGEKMGNSLFAGDFKSASASADALGRNAAKIRSVNNKLRELANKKIAEFGKKPMDFSKMTSDMGSKLSKGVRSAFNSMSGSDQNALLAAVSSRTQAEGKEKKELKVAATKRGGGGKSTGKKKGIFDFLGGDDDEKEKKPGLAAGKDLDEKGLGEYEDSTKQVSERTGTSIFKIIEIRYKKTAYPIFFEEAK